MPAIRPAFYSGRWPHKEACEAVDATSGYEQSVANALTIGV
jgi:hypothetical protein